MLLLYHVSHKIAQYYMYTFLLVVQQIVFKYTRESVLFEGFIILFLEYEFLTVGSILQNAAGQRFPPSEPHRGKKETQTEEARTEA